MKKFRCLYADPPWPETGGGRIRRGADRHYPLMRVNEIIDLSWGIRPLIAENAHLYLWTTNNFLWHAFQVMDAWGFRYVTTVTWVKDRVGLGQYFRGMTEHCLFGVRGTSPYKVVGGKRQQGRTAIVAPRGAHSVKPVEMRKMIEKVSYGPRLELFARERVASWSCWGNSVKNDVEIE